MIVVMIRSHVRSAFALLVLNVLNNLLCFLVDLILFDDFLLIENAQEGIEGQFQITDLLLERLHDLLLIWLFRHQ